MACTDWEAWHSLNIMIDKHVLCENCLSLIFFSLSPFSEMITTFVIYFFFLFQLSSSVSGGRNSAEFAVEVWAELPLQLHGQTPGRPTGDGRRARCYGNRNPWFAEAPRGRSVSSACTWDESIINEPNYPFRPEDGGPMNSVTKIKSDNITWKVFVIFVLLGRFQKILIN